MDVLIANGLCDICNWYSYNVPLGKLLSEDADGKKVYEVIQPFVCEGCKADIVTATIQPPSSFPAEFFKIPVQRKGVE